MVDWKIRSNFFRYKYLLKVKADLYDGVKTLHKVMAITQSLSWFRCARIWFPSGGFKIKMALGLLIMDPITTDLPAVWEKTMEPIHSNKQNSKRRIGVFTTTNFVGDEYKISSELFLNCYTWSFIFTYITGWLDKKSCWIEKPRAGSKT